MSLVLQISDLHFGTELPPVVAALLALAQEKQPDTLILSGDITQRGTSKQFAAARTFVDRLGIPRHLVLAGNHDIPLLNPVLRFLRPYARHRRAFGDALEPEIETADLLAVGVKTTRRWRHKDGVVSDAQIERIAARLRAASATQLRIVVTHQPIEVCRERDIHNRLHNHAAAARAWTEAGADLVLGGHIHLPYVVALNQRNPDLPRRAWCVQAGTAVSSRIRREASNSVNLIRHDAARPLHCSVERWDYNPAAARFLPIERSDLPLDRGTS